MHTEEEKELIEHICRKHDLNPKFFNKLLEIEKHYANKNMGRRAGIFKDMKELIDMWTLK
ncbi:DNA modification system-associated small protein [Bacillus kexueae]|uniref:DNA modification system-associated small protein n=1 Tax=Aeribacillus kexueae TaxID=2078952 RepID=UPI001FAF2138|nr:DNA modification system-associated small protein [Bacillus kexueae]